MYHKTIQKYHIKDLVANSLYETSLHRKLDIYYNVALGIMCQMG